MEDIKIFDIVYRKNSEIEECKLFVKMYNSLCSFNKFESILLHIPNENSNVLIEGLLKAMGKIAGAPDYIVFWENGVCFLEFKSKKGKQSEKQKEFEERAKLIKIPYFLVYSYQEAFEKLISVDKKFNFLSIL